MDSHSSNLSQVCKATDTCLWEAYGRSISRCFQDARGHLVFPRYRGKRGELLLRVSEQEARFAFVEALGQGKLRYSAEAPTSKPYRLTGARSLSARTDLAVYTQDGVPVCNVEFKAKGVSPAAKSHFAISKDIQKLLREPVWGLWFHLLKSVNNSTMNDLLKVVADEVVCAQRKHKGDIACLGLTFHICVLQPRFSLHKDLVLPAAGEFDLGALAQQLRVGCSVSRSGLLEDSDLNGWELHQYEGAPSS